jgi:ParB-like chromosome segregation protein Spo0J
MKIINLNVDLLSIDPANARKHNERNILSIMASLRRFGQQKPIVVDSSDVVRAGNGTLEAARRLQWQTIEAVRTDLKGSEATAYAIADNRTAELAEWDDAILTATLEGLQLDDALECTGFSDDELAQLTVKIMAEVDGDNETQSAQDAADDCITLSFPVSVEQELLFRKAVGKAKTTLRADSTGDAVAKIMEVWLGEDK